MLNVPSVTMNGGSLSRVTSRPLMAPIAVPTAEAEQQREQPRQPGSWPSLAITIDEERTVIAPTDRSMPAVRMTSVWPSASTAIT